MAELPFLVVHGALVWRAGVAAGGALVVRTATWRRDRKSAKFVGHATKHYTSTATGLEPGPILVRGHLRGGGAQSFEHSYLPVMHSRDEGVYLDIEGERIDFDGEIVVGCGSENRTSYWRSPVGAPALEEGVKQRAPQRLSLVRKDDEVLVAGVLRRAAAGDADYRDSAGGWRIEPFPRQGAVGLVAKNYKARAMPASPVRTLMTFGVSAVLLLLGMRTCGAIEESGHDRDPDRVHSLSIAAAMPGTRQDALEDLDRVLLEVRTPDHVDQAIALRELEHGCAAAVELMFQESRYEQALAAARRCDLGAREIDASILLGRYEEARTSRALANGGTSAQRELVAIATGHWADAATVAEPCSAALFGAFAKPTGTVPPALSAGDARCALLGTTLLPGDALGRIAEITTDRDRDAQLARALATVAAGRSESADIELAARALTDGDSREPISETVWVSKPGDVTAARAVYETYRGNFDAAQAIAGSLIKGADADDSVAAQRFAALIAVRAGRPVPPAWLEHDEALAPSSGFRDADLGAVFEILRGGSSPSLTRGAYGLSNAMEGDGRALATESRELTLTDGIKLVAVLPRVQVHRDEVIDFMNALPGQLLSAADAPFAVIRAAAMRRDVARATGNTDGVAQWQRVIDGQLGALGTRERLIGLLTR